MLDNLVAESWFLAVGVGSSILAERRGEGRRLCFVEDSVFVSGRWKEWCEFGEDLFFESFCEGEE